MNLSVTCCSITNLIVQGSRNCLSTPIEQLREDTELLQLDPDKHALNRESVDDVHARKDP